MATRIRGQFIGQPIKVDVTVDARMAAGALAAGVPACPGAFIWRGQKHQVTRVLEHGRRLSPDGYVRQYRFRIETTDGLVAVIACDRQVRRGTNPWQLLALER